MQGRLSPIHRPDIVRDRGRPRPATVCLPADEVHSPLLDTAPQSPQPNLLTPADFLRRPNYSFVPRGQASLPKFWENEARLYFAAVENTFRVKEITDNETKSDSLLAAFSKITACAYQFIVKAFVPANQNRIIAALCPSEDKNLECFLH